jgi:hypothetical protein
LFHESKIGLVDQGCGLESVLRTLSTKVMVRQAVELFVDQRH